MKMEKNQTCSDDIYLSENDQSFIQAVFLPLLISLAGLIVVAAMCGLLAWWKKIYRAVAIMSLEVIAKLALIPDVKYEFEKRSPEMFKENLQDPSSSRKNEETGKTPNNEKFFEKSVFFTVSSNCSREKYWMHPCFATYMFANGMLLTLAYASVFVTSQWELTKDCKEANVVNAPKTCYYILEECPPVNCSLWRKSGLTGDLLCISVAPDPFTPLVRFISLLSVQVVVLKFFVIIVNRACPVKPITRFCCICLFNVGFVVLLSLVTVVVGTGDIWISDRETIFANLVIPFAHLIFIAASVTAALWTLVVMMWIVGPEPQETRKRKRQKKNKRRRITTCVSSSSGNESGPKAVTPLEVSDPTPPTADDMPSSENSSIEVGTTSSSAIHHELSTLTDKPVVSHSPGVHEGGSEKEDSDSTSRSGNSPSSDKLPPLSVAETEEESQEGHGVETDIELDSATKSTSL